MLMRVREMERFTAVCQRMIQEKKKRKKIVKKKLLEESHETHVNATPFVEFIFNNRQTPPHKCNRRSIIRTTHKLARTSVSDTSLTNAAKVRCTFFHSQTCHSSDISS